MFVAGGELSHLLLPADKNYLLAAGIYFIFPGRQFQMETNRGEMNLNLGGSVVL